jgi:hypothetical protein
MALTSGLGPVPTLSKEQIRIDTVTLTTVVSPCLPFCAGAFGAAFSILCEYRGEAEEQTQQDGTFDKRQHASVNRGPLRSGSESDVSEVGKQVLEVPV